MALDHQHRRTPEDVTLDFLDGLYRDVDTGWLNLFAVDRTSGIRPPIAWAPADDRELLTAQAADLAPHCCVWFSAATRKERLATGRGGAADCAQLPGLWLDADIAGPNHADSDRLPAGADQALELVDRFPLRPSCVVHTGGGLQAFWAFDEPHDIGAATVPLLDAWRHTWDTIAGRMGLRVDNVFDVARILRLPGTWNRKQRDHPRFVEVIQADWTVRYGLDDLEPHLLDPPPPAELTAGPRTAYSGPQRPGDAYNARHTGGDVLTRLGFVLEHSDAEGAHYTRPGKDPRLGASATVYADDGHTTIWSDAVLTRWPRVELKRPYDPFGLHVATEYAGDYAAATRALRAEGYGEPLAEVGDLISDNGTTPATVETTLEAGDQKPERRYVRGGTFILDAPDTIPAIWGQDDQVLWASGEGLIIAGPPGVGKTTLAGQIVFARIGLGGDVLGHPVARTSSRVLYLASDRPAQIRRSLRRLAQPEHRADLDERLVVWPGPPPADLAKQPHLLLELARETGADTVFLDSLKDMAIGISDDEVGAGLNHAIQRALANGIEVAALHHQRKGQNGTKPRTLEDLYGSTWLAAGAGSVLLLWGTAGDAIVEVVHLKQPAAAVGPLKVEHDHVAGATTVYRGFDALAWLRGRGLTGGSAIEAARAKFERDNPTDNQRKGAQRELDKLVAKGLATRSEAEFGGTGGTQPITYRIVDNPRVEVADLVVPPTRPGPIAEADF